MDIYTEPEPYDIYYITENKSTSGINYLMKLVLSTRQYPEAYELIRNIDLDQLYEVDVSRHTALHIACMSINTYSTTDTIKLLLSMYDNIDITDDNDHTPLYYACKYGVGLDIIKQMLKQGAMINYFILKQVCCKSKDVALMKLLLKYLNKNDISIDDFIGSAKNNILYAACNVDNNYDIIKLIVDANINLNHRNSAGNTALHALVTNANTRYNIDIIKYLIDCNADPTIRSKTADTLLHTACIYFADDTCIIKLLVELNIDINSVNINGQTALHAACISRQSTKYERIKTLLELNADPNIISVGRTSPLCLVKYSDHKFIDLLVRAGADIMYTLESNPAHPYLTEILKCRQNKIKRANM